MIKYALLLVVVSLTVMLAAHHATVAIEQVMHRTAHVLGAPVVAKVVNN